MTGKRLNLNRLVLLVLALLAFDVCYSQIDFESRAIKYFCLNKLKIDPTLKGMDIIYNQVVEPMPSKIYDVADCLRDINLMKDSIPNKLFLDSLRKVYSARQYDRRDLDLDCDLPKKRRSLFKRDVFYMSVYHSIIYKERNVVEIFLHNRKRKTHHIIIMSFDKQGQVIDYCLQHITYD